MHCKNLPVLAATAFLTLSSLSVRAADRELYELRTYHFKNEEKAKIFDDMMEKAGLPALKRLGIGPVGVFAPKNGKGDAAQRLVVATHPSFDTIAGLPSLLEKDTSFVEAAAEYLEADPSDPVFTRVESSILVAFEGMPKFVAPENKSKSGKRYFELRIYESATEFKAGMKVLMFNKGELDIFKDVGLTAVFFGEAVAAKNLPQLTYMLVYENEDEKKAAWKRFLEAPAWIDLKGEEKYKGTVSKIHSEFYVALPYSPVK